MSRPPARTVTPPPPSSHTQTHPTRNFKSEQPTIRWRQETEALKLLVLGSRFFFLDKFQAQISVKALKEKIGNCFFSNFSSQSLSIKRLQFAARQGRKLRRVILTPVLVLVFALSGRLLATARPLCGTVRVIRTPRGLGAGAAIGAGRWVLLELRVKV